MKKSMRPHYNLFVLVIMIIFFSCDKEENSINNGNINDQSKLFPLKSNNNWTYKYSYKENGDNNKH